MSNLIAKYGAHLLEVGLALLETTGYGECISLHNIEDRSEACKADYLRKLGYTVSVPLGVL